MPTRPTVAATSRSAVLVVAVITALALVAAACSGGPSGKVVAVQTVDAPSSTRTISADGALESPQQVPVQAPFSGKVAAVDVADGASTTAGTTLFRMDTATLQEQLDALDSGDTSSSSSSSSSSASSSGRTTTTTNPQAGLQGQLQPVIDAAQAQIANLVAQILVKDPSVNPAEPTETPTVCTPPAVILNPATCSEVLELQQEILAINQRVAEFTVQAGLDLQNAALQAQGGATLGGLPDLGGGGGASGSLDAQKSQLRSQINEATVTAPTDGVISLAQLGQSSVPGLPSAPTGSVNIRPGTLVTAGQTVLTLYDVNAVQVKANVGEANIPLVKVGQKAVVDVDAYPDVTIEGVVTTISVSPTTQDAGGVAYEVNVSIPVSQVPNWRPGMTATVDIEVEQGTTGIELPSSAIVRDDGKDFVFKDVDGTAVRTEVTRRSGSEGKVIVTNGLQAGDKVVTSGAGDLTDGEAIRTEGGR